MVTAVKGLPTQQQLLLCAATSLLGADGPPPGISNPGTTLKQRRSSLGFGSPLSVSKQARPLSYLSCTGPFLLVLRQALCMGRAGCDHSTSFCLPSPYLMGMIQWAAAW